MANIIVPRAEYIPGLTPSLHDDDDPRYSDILYIECTRANGEVDPGDFDKFTMGIDYLRGVLDIDNAAIEEVRTRVISNRDHNGAAVGTHYAESWRVPRHVEDYLGYALLDTVIAGEQVLTVSELGLRKRYEGPLTMARRIGGLLLPAIEDGALAARLPANELTLHVYSDAPSQAGIKAMRDIGFVYERPRIVEPIVIGQSQGVGVFEANAGMVQELLSGMLGPNLHWEDD